eukprot:635110-Amphidinium_carterae.4
MYRLRCASPYKCARLMSHNANFNGFPRGDIPSVMHKLHKVLTASSGGIELNNSEAFSCSPGRLAFFTSLHTSIALVRVHPLHGQWFLANALKALAQWYSLAHLSTFWLKQGNHCMVAIWLEPRRP